MALSHKKTQKIQKVLIFYNNYRGLNLSKFLSNKGFEVFNIVTRKFLNKRIINKIDENKLKIINNLKSKHFFNFIYKKKFDLIISAGFPHIFSKKFFNISKYGIINLHAGKLPKYRGGSPLVWQILNDEKKIGISVIKINNKLDQGKIVCKSEFENLKKDNIMNIQKKANKLFLNLTLKAIKNILQNKPMIKQPSSKSYFHQRYDKDALINFNQKNLEVFNLVRSQSTPYKGAFFFIKRKKYRLLECKMTNFNPKIKNGELFKLGNEKQIFIKCKSKSIEIKKIVPEINFSNKIKIL
ncbi:MAG: hypothetical protein CMI79_05785 [Candidatus Pelagibacter sp.]|nr:hypothetical protein [Candidatus Pelagibacter sp.]|tara:strand:- start:4708 stop:5598 length:891 start_codon:yes stop_codon:yes gene_type:complete